MFRLARASTEQPLEFGRDIARCRLISWGGRSLGSPGHSLVEGAAMIQSRSTRWCGALRAWAMAARSPAQWSGRSAGRRGTVEMRYQPTAVTAGGVRSVVPELQT